MEDKKMVQAELYEALSNSVDGYMVISYFQGDTYETTIPENLIKDFDLTGDYTHHFFELWNEKILDIDRPKHESSIRAMLEGYTQIITMQYRAKNQKGDWIWLDTHGYMMRDEQGAPKLMAAVIRNLGENNQLDHTTGLLNKYAFRELVSDLMERDVQCGILLLNIDDFHYINELYNSEYGDLVLRTFGEYVKSRMDSNASVFRLEGDEFGVVFVESDEEQVRNFYNRIVNHYRTHKELQGKTYFITISATYYEVDTDNYDDVVRSLKVAMRVVKRQGKNLFLPFRKEFLSYNERELELIELLRVSVENNFEGFHLNFQPQVYADTKTLKGSEALLRWSCDKYGKIGPDEFVPLLEKSNLIVPVGKWVFAQAVDMCKHWVVFFPDFSMSINVSYLQLFDESFVDFMKNTVEEAGIDYQNIIVEITESKFISDKDLLKRMFRSVRDLGMKIAMDDFGTGYSSLGILKEAPADIVKIDKIFVRNIKENSFDSSFIRVVVELCHKVGIKVCLEGVEEDEEMAVVSEMDLDFIQGYLYGRPEEADTFRQLYLQNSEV